MISILFATYNGADTLPTMLEAFCHLNIPKLGWKIIAVDNASTDNTAEILKSFQKQLPITYLYEEKKGKNNALNLGLNELEGSLVVLTDDDIIPEKNWLIELDSCAKSQPGFEIFAGATKPHWPTNLLPEHLQFIPLSVAYGVTGGVNWQSGEIQPGEVFGANMMVRKDLFDKGAKFNTSVGPKGLNYAMGSETEFTQRLASIYKAKCFFCPTALVEHIIHPEQLSKKWIKSRAFKSGRGSSMKEYHKKINEKNIFNIPFWLFLLYAKKQILSWLSFFSSQPSSLSKTWQANFYRGYIFQHLRTHFNK